MALTEFQTGILRMLAKNRIASGESYVAGGAALNQLLSRPRVSHDIDVFNDTYEAMTSSAAKDRETLEAAGLEVEILRNLQFMVEMRVSRGDDTTDIQWVQDSAYRFFPLVEDEVFGFTLHPLDLATNKILALVGRRMPRDWIDAVSCSEVLQPLGLIFWAASGKDPGLSPRFIAETAARIHYSQTEVDIAVTTGERIDVAAVSRKWHDLIECARSMIAILPPSEMGKAVLRKDGKPFNGTETELRAALAAGEVVFHEGRICGAWPRIIG